MEDKKTEFDKRFLELLQKRREEYKKLPPMFCPALRENTHFTMRGFNHLRFKIDNTPRNPKEAMYKLGLLPLVKPVIYHAKTAVYERRLAPLGGSRKVILKEMDYWALTAVVGAKKVKIKVVLRKLVNGDQIHFWSVMKLGENQKSPSIDGDA